MELKGLANVIVLKVLLAVKSTGIWNIVMSK